MTVYLAGPINNTEDPESWRNRLRENLDAEVLDPLQIEDHSDSDVVPVTVVDDDIAAIHEADVVIVRREPHVETWGTPMEMRVAFSTHTRVIGINPSTEQASPWFRYHADEIVGSCNECIELLNQ